MQSQRDLATFLPSHDTQYQYWNFILGLILKPILFPLPSKPESHSGPTPQTSFLAHGFMEGDLVTEKTTDMEKQTQL